MTEFEIVFKLTTFVVFCAAGVLFATMAIYELKNKSVKNPIWAKALLVFQIILSFIIFLMGALVWSI